MTTAEDETVAALCALSDEELARLVPAYTKAYKEGREPTEEERAELRSAWQETAQYASGQRSIVEFCESLPRSERRDVTALGGSVQACLVRFTRPDGSSFITSNLIEARFENTPDGRTLSIPMCLADPALLAFACGGTTTTDEASGKAIGWVDPGGAYSAPGLHVDVWSLRMSGGSVSGFFRWFADCGPMRFGDLTLSGRDSTIPAMHAAVKPGTFGFLAEDELPENWFDGFTAAPEATA